jgi:hypothetical protein
VKAALRRYPDDKRLLDRLPRLVVPPGIDGIEALRFEIACDIRVAGADPRPIER